MHTLLDWLQIMPKLANIDLDSLLMNLLHICVKIICSRWEDTFYLSMYSIISLETLKWNPQRCFHFSRVQS